MTELEVNPIEFHLALTPNHIEDLGTVVSFLQKQCLVEPSHRNAREVFHPGRVVLMLLGVSE
mgnify:CR=1 FL=1